MCSISLSESIFESKHSFPKVNVSVTKIDPCQNNIYYYIGLLMSSLIKAELISTSLHTDPQPYNMASASYWCACFWPNCQTQTPWGRHEARRPVVGPVLTAQHPAARLAFTREQQNWQVSYWRPILFADESRFTLSTCVFKCGYESSPHWVDDFGFHWALLHHFDQSRFLTWTSVPLFFPVVLLWL